MASTKQLHAYGGIFSNDEQTLIFLGIMQRLARRAITTLRDASQRMGMSNLSMALGTIPTWTSDIQREESDMAISLFPRVCDLYRYVFLRFIQQTNEGIERSVIDVAPFHVFLHSFYTFMSESPHACNDRMHLLGPTDSQVLVMDWIRSALYNVSRGSVMQQVDHIVGPWDSVSNVADDDDDDDADKTPTPSAVPSALPSAVPSKSKRGPNAGIYLESRKKRRGSGGSSADKNDKKQQDPPRFY